MHLWIRKKIQKVLRTKSIIYLFLVVSVSSCFIKSRTVEPIISGVYLNKSQNPVKDQRSLTHYGQTLSYQLTNEEKKIWAEVFSLLNSQCQLDDPLVKTAREHAGDLKKLFETPQEHEAIDYLRFSLLKSGSYDYRITPIIFNNTKEGLLSFFDLLQKRSRHLTHCAIGLSATDSEQTGVFLGAKRLVNTNSIPINPKPHTQFILEGFFDRNQITQIDIFLETPSGKITKKTAQIIKKDYFNVLINLEEAGKYAFEIVAHLVSGPETATLVPLFVGIPKELRPTIIPSDPLFEQTPEDYLTKLINNVRKRAGLLPLKRDTKLDRIAKSHCMEMVANNTFGHFSKQTGHLKNRLEAAFLYPEKSAENIARSFGLVRAHHNLMRSPSHKIKLLDPDFTHIGIGIEKNDKTYLVTQLFARW